MICWEKVICSGQPSMSRCTISPLSAESLTRDYSKRLGGPSWPLVRTDRRLQYGESICVMYPVSPCVPPVYKSQLVHGSLTKDSCTSPSSCMNLWRKIRVQVPARAWNFDERFMRNTGSCWSRHLVIHTSFARFYFIWESNPWLQASNYTNFAPYHPGRKLLISSE